VTKKLTELSEIYFKAQMGYGELKRKKSQKFLRGWRRSGGVHNEPNELRRLSPWLGARHQWTAGKAFGAKTANSLKAHVFWVSTAVPALINRRKNLGTAVGLRPSNRKNPIERSKR